MITTYLCVVTLLLGYGTDDVSSKVIYMPVHQPQECLDATDRMRSVVARYPNVLLASDILPLKEEKTVP